MRSRHLAPVSISSVPVPVDWDDTTRRVDSYAMAKAARRSVTIADESERPSRAAPRVRVGQLLFIALLGTAVFVGVVVGLSETVGRERPPIASAKVAVETPAPTPAPTPPTPPPVTRPIPVIEPLVVRADAAAPRVERPAITILVEPPDGDVEITVNGEPCEAGTPVEVSRELDGLARANIAIRAPGFKSYHHTVYFDHDTDHVASLDSRGQR